MGIMVFRAIWNIKLAEKKKILKNNTEIIPMHGHKIKLWDHEMIQVSCWGTLRTSSKENMNRNMNLQWGKILSGTPPASQLFSVHLSTTIQDTHRNNSIEYFKMKDWELAGAAWCSTFTQTEIQHRRGGAINYMPDIRQECVMTCVRGISKGHNHKHSLVGSTLRPGAVHFWVLKSKSELAFKP